MMLLRPRRIVGLGELTEAVWGTAPPATVRGQVQTCISRLRRLLPPDAIITDPAGYGIDVADGDLDSERFLALVETARSAPDGGDARAAYRQALELWRGPACAEIEAPGVRQAAAMLDERHALAIEDAIDLELAAGRARELLGELTAQVERFPLRERLRGQLMLALFRSGRQADALAEFRRARDVLSEELGIEPGRELQELHRDILVGTVPEVAPVVIPADPVRQVPVHCLPRSVPDFTGRAGLVDRLLAGAVATERGPAIVVIDGMAGSGKTTLALHLAGLLGDRFPDAHLFVDLQGHSEHDPVDPSAALLVLLRQLGLPADGIPPALVDRIGLWRTELARRRALVIFDNAGSSAQVAELLPTSPGSVALVTSRRRLAGLDGVNPESLPVLAQEEAIALLERIVGERVREDPEASAEVVRRCGGLPLAVRLAGARLAHRPRWRVADLLRRLGESALPELAAEDRTVASTFALSYGQLSEGTQRFFGLLGLYPGMSLDAPAAAALSGSDLDCARELLDELVDVHLIEEPEPGVYRLHDLLREFAAALAGQLSEPERQQALLGLLDLETHAAVASCFSASRPSLDEEFKHVPHRRPELAAAIADPFARLERQRADLSAFVEAAARSEHPQYAWLLPRAAWCLLFYRGYTEDVGVLHERGLAVAQRSGDETAVAMMVNGLASYHYRCGEYDTARKYVLIAVRAAEKRGDLRIMANKLGNLATLDIATSRFAEAVETSQRAGRIAALGRSRIIGMAALFQLSNAYQHLGNYAEALRLDRIRLLSGDIRDNAHQQAGSLLNIQRSKRRLGLATAPAAQRYVEVALRLILRQGIAVLEADARTELGTVLAEQGDFESAVVQHRLAVEIADRVGEVRYAAEHLHDYAVTLLRSGDDQAALASFERSLRLARQARQPYSIARALAGIGDCVAGGDPDRARRLWSEARGMFEEMGTPERHVLAGRLRRIGIDCGPADLERGWSGDD
ncbi:BTAD domain-containing putative transcriptional regulator [Actinoplanes sp. NPDC023801]|uniref:AfsR/SARP family transcriptional regulator n=1 Tax=Actinoplanes sp. NPDC023801 TaxID=3154595 RepID=UPI0033DA0F93